MDAGLNKLGLIYARKLLENIKPVYVKTVKWTIARDGGRVIRSRHRLLTGVK